MSVIPIFCNLFGPVQSEGALRHRGNGEWGFGGDALTASTKTFDFQLGLTSLALARWRVVWTPQIANNALRLVHFHVPTELVEIVVMQGCDRLTPMQQVIDITGPLNALITERRERQIGFQIKVGSEHVTLYESRLEFYFEGGVNPS